MATLREQRQELWRRFADADTSTAAYGKARRAIQAFDKKHPRVVAALEAENPMHKQHRLDPAWRDPHLRGGAGGCFTQYVSGGGASVEGAGGFGKPIVIARARKGYTIHVNGVPLVDMPDGSAGFPTQPAGMNKRPSFALPGAPVHIFSKLEQAKWAAHKIGHYMMRLGDLVFSYTELPPGSRW